MKNNEDRVLPIRDKILNAAEKLFYNDGIQTVGIDKIIKEAGVAMNTLYRYFPSKDILVKEYLKNRDQRWRKWFNSHVVPGASLGENISHLFDALNDWFNEETFRGCAFINVAGEVGDSKPDIFEISRSHKEDLYRDILALCYAAEVKEAEKLAKQVSLLMEGAMVRAHLNNDKDAAIMAKEIAMTLIG